MPAVRRLVLSTAATCVGLLVVAPAAFAVGGEGLLGETSDATITWAAFILIVFFPLFVSLASLLLWRLEKRKHARDDARKAREKSAEWSGGW
jgi:membrane protein implicated in regulation of membrane protease activity